ncbi:hypothetical protein FKM82_005588 [Ascaphus truei]
MKVLLRNYKIIPQPRPRSSKACHLQTVREAIFKHSHRKLAPISHATQKPKEKPLRSTSQFGQGTHHRLLTEGKKHKRNHICE